MCLTYWILPALLSISPHSFGSHLGAWSCSDLENYELKKINTFLPRLDKKRCSLSLSFSDTGWFHRSFFGFKIFLLGDFLENPVVSFLQKLQILWECAKITTKLFRVVTFHLSENCPIIKLLNNSHLLFYFLAFHIFTIFYISYCSFISLSMLIKKWYIPHFAFPPAF